MKKRILSLLLIVCLLGSLLPLFAPTASAATYSGTCGDNLTWTLDTSTGVLAISGSGSMKDYTSSGSAPWNRYRYSIDEVVIEDGITSIGKMAFSDYSGLTSVTIPGSVTSIGEMAFSGCTWLASVTIGNGVTCISKSAFARCSEGLTSVTIPDSVTSIGDYAFEACESLTSVKIGNSVTSIGGNAFKNCDSLTSVTIPDSVTSIGNYAFEACESLTSVMIGSGVTSIGQQAFSLCYHLTGIWVDAANKNYSSNSHGVLFDKDSTTLIRFPQAYSGAYTIPDSVRSIGEWAFRGCSGLTSVTIPDSVTDISRYAFRDCYSLTSVYILNPDCELYASTDTLGVAGTTTIYGHHESTAQEYANTYGYDFAPLCTYTYTDNGNKTHTITCDTCDYSEIAECVFENGECVCGAKEALEPIYDEAVKFSHSLTLENDISINFIGLGSALSVYDTFYLECKVPVYEGNELVGYETVKIDPVYNGKNYECTLLGITAKMMNDDIEAVFHMTKDGQEYYSKTDVYSVAEYAYGKLDSTKATDTAELKAICANLLRYGSMAQTQFGYRTDALVDADMTDAHKAFLTDLSKVEMKDYRKQLSDLDTVIVPWKSTTLELGNKVIMCLIANLANYAGDPSELTMRLTYTDAKGVAVTEERPLALYNPEALTYAVSYDGLRATEMRSIVSAAIYRNGERVSKTVEYSIESYGARNADFALQELCLAMLAYGDSANAFFSK